MDCGIPFCHQGCPVNNMIPDWNNLVYRDQWQAALETLHSTNNFPEFTGRICPAPCEASCTLNIDDNPVTIKTIECQIVDRGWDEGWIHPYLAPKKTGKRVAVIGSGPAGMACAQQLARAGHSVTLFEKSDRIGGLLRYGIPDFKMEKYLIDRRMRQMEAEGVEFRAGVEVGVTVSIKSLLETYRRDRHGVRCRASARSRSAGPRAPRHPFRDGLSDAAEQARRGRRRDARGAARHAHREGQARHRHRRRRHRFGLHRHREPPGRRLDHAARDPCRSRPRKKNKALTWPDWPLKMRTSSSQEEGCDRDWAVLTKRAIGSHGKVEALECVRVEWAKDASGRFQMKEVEGSSFALKADLVLLAMGFLGPRKPGLVDQSGVELDPRSNVKANVMDYQTSAAKIFACGDMRRGQSLVVWAIREGRQCARAVDQFLMGSSDLPR